MACTSPARLVSSLVVDPILRGCRSRCNHRRRRQPGRALEPRVGVTTESDVESGQPRAGSPINDPAGGPRRRRSRTGVDEPEPFDPLATMPIVANVHAGATPIPGVTQFGPV